MKESSLFIQITKRLEDIEKLPKIDESKSIPKILEEKILKEEIF